MNEQIKELALQAGWRFADEATGNFSEYDKRLEKFAELIVRECAKVVFEKTGPKSALNVLEHFGVDK